MILKYKLKKQDKTTETANIYIYIIWDMEKEARENGNEPLDSITHREFDQQRVYEFPKNDSAPFSYLVSLFVTRK